MHHVRALLTATSLASLTSAFPTTTHANTTCKPFSGNFSIHQYQLYPENADFDFNSCVLYIGQLWNASLGFYDPYTQKHETIEFDGVSHNSAFHLGAVGVNQRTGLLSFISDAAGAFGSNGEDITGTNWLFQFNPKTREIVYKINLTETSQGKYGGFQDMEHDPDNNTFVVGTFPSSILKVSKDGKTVTPWYLHDPVDHRLKGIGGLAADGWLLLAQGDKDGILKFDLRAEKGVPKPVTILGNHTFGASDAISLPRRYNGSVLLVAEDEIGTSVFHRRDPEWNRADYLGLVPRNDPSRGNVAAPIQIGDGIYTVLEPFQDEGLKGPGTAGNRTEFLFRDITKEVEALLAAKN